ncbi:MAG: SMP-30/gluconolactonase/LRE family protein [Actinobacteria bacterium]|nr:SMP-30/gluconolactonase/LRE family protein [Actinomycetota bacterium]
MAAAALDRLVAGGPPEAVASGFTYTEGPVWHAPSAALLFHDIPSDRRLRWSAAAGLETVAHPTGKGNGMALDRAGRLLVCESGAHRVVRHEPDGAVTVLAERYEGRELNSPNDLAVHSGGDVYFTDPAYGRIPVYGVERPRELDVQGVYRVRAGDGALELLCDDFAQPNGICFSPDERRLYVNDTERAEVRAFDVAADGTLRDGAILHAPVGPALAFEDARRNVLPHGFVDGMKCDERGNVYVTGPGGIWVLDPGGDRVGVVELPEDVANFAWGGEDGRDLFCCCRSALVRVRMRVRGTA